jgi:hypothetical protein
VIVGVDSSTTEQENGGNMTHLKLTDEEADTLIQVLSYYISELRMEVTDTDQQEMRDALKVEEAMLKRVLQVLKGGGEK